MKERLYFVVGNYENKINPCVDFTSEIKKNELKCGIRPVFIDTDLNDFSFLEIFNLNNTCVDDFIGMPDIVESIVHEKYFVEAFLKIATDLYTEIISEELYGTFLTWTYPMYDSDATKYPIESASWMFERKHCFGLRVDYRFKIIVENIFKDVPTDLFIQSDSKQFLYLNFKEYVKKTKNSDILNQILGDEKYYFLIK
jgi:hypothetical protein